MPVPRRCGLRDRREWIGSRRGETQPSALQRTGRQVRGATSCRIACGATENQYTGSDPPRRRSRRRARACRTRRPQRTANWQDRRRRRRSARRPRTQRESARAPASRGVMPDAPIRKPRKGTHTSRSGTSGHGAVNASEPRWAVVCVDQGSPARPRPWIMRSICRWARRSQSPVPGSGRESSEVAMMRSSAVRSARSWPAVWPRSIKPRRAVRTSAWRWRVAGVKTLGPPCRGSTKRSRSRRVARKNSRIAVQGGPRVRGGRACVLDGKSEGAVHECTEQVFAGGEVPVDGADAHAGTLGDGGHRHPLALEADQFGRGVQHALAVGGRVLTELARRWHAGEDRSIRTASKRMVSSRTEADEIVRNTSAEFDEHRLRDGRRLHVRAPPNQPDTRGQR